MNNTIGHAVLRSRKHASLRSINVQHQSSCRREFTRDGTGSHDDGARNWPRRVLDPPANCESQRASRAEQGRGFQNWPVSAVESFLANVLVRAATCRQHLPRSTFRRGQQFKPTTSSPTRSFSSSRRLCTDSIETSLASKPKGDQSTALGSTAATLSELVLQGDASLRPVIQVGRKEPTPAQITEPRKIAPKNREEMQTLVMFLKELSSPTEIKTLDSLFYHYRGLPTPRLSYLRTAEINLLLSRFMSAPVRTDILMTRFLSIIDDMRELQIPISRREWISVISYVGQRFNLKVGLPEIEATLKLWRELEKKAGLEVGPTLFNILLDMASKANQHSLVSAIMAEMKYRQIKPDRYTLTTMITWYGILKSATGVRETFTELVQKGEVVDTVIYNALIMAFIRAGEWDTAEEIFERMKNLASKIKVKKKKESFAQGLNPDGSPISPSRDHVSSRRFAKALKQMAKQHQLKSAPEHVPFPGDHGSLVYCGPNIVTFNIFLNNHCHHGDFEKVTEILTEMKHFKISLEPSIFISLFRGFKLHGEGRAKRSKWTKDRIEEVYAALLREVYQKRAQQLEEVRLSTLLACEIVKAFAVTTRSRAKTLKVYRDMVYLYEQGYGNDKEMDPVVQRVVQRAIGVPISDGDALNPVCWSNDNQIDLGGDRLDPPEYERFNES